LPVPPDEYLAGMRRLAAHVTVVTTRHGVEPRGLTATAVCSLSAEPPRLLTCINRDAHAHEAIGQAGIFAVNVLRRSDKHLAEVFAGRTGRFGADRFGHGNWSRLVTGAPVLDTAIAVFDCRVVEAVAAATHSIFLGEVEAVLVAEGEPLLYADGSFGSLAPGAG
jgi:flavin reductase (DIM6/NTAB) family NADH-FMN oxidoreductase RutF